MSTNVNTVSIVIGSWGSYNECNKRALGSKWLDLSDYFDWDEITVELKNEGFILDGIDEELFIQDIEGIPSNSDNWDYVNPQNLFETLLESGVLSDSYKFDIMQAYIEIESFSDFCELVKNKGNRWDDDINIYQKYSWEDYGREMFNNCCYQIDESLLDFFNFEAYGEYMGTDYAHEYSDGIIEIIR